MATTDDTAQLVTLAQKVAADATSDAAALAGALTSAKDFAAQLTAAQAIIASQTAEIAALKNPPTPAPTPTPVPAGRKLLWEDRFTTLDKTRWNVRQEAEGGGRLGYCQPANVTVQADGLHITTKRENVGGRSYTTGYIDTIGKFSMPTGRWEMDARLPAASAVGLWPAFWLRCDSTLGEIDILEAIGGLPHMLVQTVHQSSNGDQDRSGNDYENTAFDPTQLHTYGLERDADGAVRWYLDGTLIFTRKPTDLSSKGHIPMAWLNGPTYASPLNIRINTQVSGAMPTYYGKTVGAGTVLPADYVIRAVRVYQ